MPSLIISILFSSKLLIIMLNSEKVKICLNTIQKDWQSVNTDVERIILQQHTRYGQYLATFYAVFVHTMTTLFMLKPIIVSLITDDISNTTKSSIPIASRLPFNVEYGEKFNQYIYLIAIHNYMAVFTRSFATIAVDNLYYVLIQHACGMFSIIGNVLENIGKNNANDFIAKSDKIKDNNYSKTLHCLRRHLDVIEFAENIEALFTKIFLINLNLNMICGSLAGLQVLMNLERNTSDISVPIIIYTAQFIHLFLHFWNAQFLLDYSVLPYKSICKANWYYTSQKCQKLLLLIMNRTTTPCKITAGKIVILSIESFATVLKTSISYLTMFRSLQ
ncbi:PREDICTED: odorant receptor 13a-like [Trachymyrmex cornetzi]|uniref:odorant receptor 13a-like n=1 Tax=Trachymyrmex cornetzi TaxID=471704 RepID=UPI00084F107E|nr:PREDICTED: odorant receptor 13a-like [Trachymyrmex cornetzi]